MSANPRVALLPPEMRDEIVAAADRAAAEATDAINRMFAAMPPEDFLKAVGKLVPRGMPLRRDPRVLPHLAPADPPHVD